MKKNKGFTLVELLAVIVILAIIMIIAIPAVLNTMQSAQRKSFLEFAQKTMNEAEKTYLSKNLLGSTLNPSEETFHMFDIKNDLGLTNTGDYYGVVSIVILKNEYGETITHNLFLFNKDLALLYDERENKELTDQLIQNRNQLFPNMPLEKYDLKEYLAVNGLSDICNYWDRSVVDGANNTQYYCTNPNKRSVWDYTNNKCPYNDAQINAAKGPALQKYLLKQQHIPTEPPITCPIG